VLLDLTASNTFAAITQAKYAALVGKLSRLLPEWKVEIQTYTMGIRGSFSPDTWKANLARFGLKGKKVDNILCKLEAQALNELTDIYEIRYAALQQLHCHDPN